jgi:photosystem II stability/assembly factor-like uncharacterized protein
MELRPGWKTRWIAISVLALPTIVFFVYSLRNPAVNAKGKAPARQTGMLGAAAPPPSPWVMQDSGTTAGLRGIDSVDGKIAWASGTGGTVLRTLDGGEHWTKCAVPGPDGETLDFRGVQAWDATTAIIMASGPGDKSRLYKTSDGCKSWTLVFTNPDKDGFWDALYIRATYGLLLGDPVNGSFSLFETSNSGSRWLREQFNGIPKVTSGQGAFAASNSSLIEVLGFKVFGSGGKDGAFVYSMAQSETCFDDCPPEALNRDGRKDKWIREEVPVGSSTESSGVFSVGAHSDFVGAPLGASKLVAVGGDYSHPGESVNTAAFRLSADKPWTAATKPPHGYRSSVQWSEDLKAWITVGTNGSDISRDDGKTWQPLDDGEWNALSLPFVVGPKGRIARLKIPLAP